MMQGLMRNDMEMVGTKKDFAELAELEALKGRRDVNFKLPDAPNFSDPDTSASLLG